MRTKTIAIILIIGIFSMIAVILLYKYRLLEIKLSHVNSSSGRIQEYGDLRANRVDLAIDTVWDNIHLGDINFKSQKYEEAAKFYKKALDVDVWTGGSGVAGKYLIETYEAMKRYDEALEYLESITKRFYKNQDGTWKTEYAREAYETTQSRILAAKNQVKK